MLPGEGQPRSGSGFTGNGSTPDSHTHMLFPIPGNAPPTAISSTASASPVTTYPSRPTLVPAPLNGNLMSGQPLSGSHESSMSSTPSFSMRPLSQQPGYLQGLLHPAVSQPSTQNSRGPSELTVSSATHMGPLQKQLDHLQGNIPPAVRHPLIQDPKGTSISTCEPPTSLQQSQYPRGHSTQPCLVTPPENFSNQSGILTANQCPQGGPQVFGSHLSQPPFQTPFLGSQNMRGPPPYASIRGSPRGRVQELVKDFQSLSVASYQGSVGSGIDDTSLPRPLDGSEVDDPPSSTIYTANCHSRYVRFTTNAVPSSQSLQSRWHLPLGLLVHPLAESPIGEDVPTVKSRISTIQRCRQCRAYINPYVNFVEYGRRWTCNLCSISNDVVGDYFGYLDANGRRNDLAEHPELCKGSVEFVAPTEYMFRPPMLPTYFFLIDVSFGAIESGMLKVATETIKSTLPKLPGFPRTQIGFLTFNSRLHFYNLKSNLTQPQMMVIGDLDEPFIPLPDLLVNLSESHLVIEALLDSLPSMFEDTDIVESAFGSALKSAFMIMNQNGGKLLIFQSTLPSLGVGRLKPRGNDMKIYGTDKEYTLRIPEDSFYKQMAAEFTKYQIGVNLYAFGDNYKDVASLGTLAKYTGGQVYYYPSFVSSLHGDKFSYELRRDLTRDIAWEAVMRIRCGTGVRLSSYHGHFMLRSSDLLGLPTVDCDKAFAIQFSLEDASLTASTLYFQVSLLYTASSGERRIRVHTAALPVVSKIVDMYHNADVGAVMGLLSRLAIEKTLTSKLEEARRIILLRIVRCLKEYRNLFTGNNHLAGQFIYPESLRLLPIYGLALSKSLALRGGFSDANIDERSAAGFNMMIIPIQKLLKLLYPSLIRLDEYLLKSSVADGHDDKLFNYLPLSAGKLDYTGLYLLDDGFRFIVWLGKALSKEFVYNLLGTEAANSPDLSKVPGIVQNNDLSKKFFSTLKILRERDPAFYQHCNLVRQGEQPREGFLFLVNLVEEPMSGTNGYLDWVLQIHRQIQQKA